MPYAIRLPDGTLVENIPDEITPQDAKRRIVKQYPQYAPETTVAGNVKEFFKGLAPGAINLTESAVKGAAAILPEEAEKSVVSTAKQIAQAGRAPMQAAPGYEDSVGRKFGEAVGSTAPFFALGPLGAAGKLAAVGLGTAAGAGEARGRAETEGATADQRSTATALGAAVGVTEALPVFKFLDTLSTPIKQGMFNYVRRAAATGGAEGAQEAAAQLAQNLIAKGIYKPEQELIEGTGESAAYGGATGALIQAITDMALGRRAKGASSGPQSELTPIEQARAKAREEAAAKAATQTEATSGIKPTTELFDIAVQPNGYGELERYKQSLFKMPRTEETKAALKEVTDLQRTMNVELVGRNTPAAPTPATESAFDTPQGELFDDKLFTPDRLPEQEQVDQAPAVAPGQAELPFAEETGQVPLFPELGYGSEQNVVYSGSDSAIVVDDAMLQRLGLKPKQPVYQRLIGKRLDRTSELNFVRDEVESYATKFAKDEIKPQLTEFLTNIDALRAPNRELPLAEPRVRKKGQKNVDVPLPTDGTGEATPSEPISTPPSSERLGVDSQPTIEPTVQQPAAQPDASGVDLFSGPATGTDGVQGRADTALTFDQATDALQQAQIKARKAKVRQDRLDNKLATDDPKRLKAVAERIVAEQEADKAAEVAASLVPETKAPKAPVTKQELFPTLGQGKKAAKETPKPVEEKGAAIEYDEGIVQDLVDLKRKLAQDIKAQQKAREALRTQGGALTPENKATYELAGRSIENYKGQIAEVNAQLTAQNKAKRNIAAGASTKVDSLIVRGSDKNLPDPAPKFKQAEKEIIEAVGAYNSPASDAWRRKSATDFIFDIASGADPQYPKAAVNFAKRALKNGIDPADLTEPQKRKYDELTKDVGEDQTAWGSYVYAKRDTTGTTAQAIDDAVAKGDTKGALQAIVKYGNPLDKLVAERLLKLSSLPDIKLVTNEPIDGPAAYQVLTDTVLIRPGEVDTHTVLHEVSHSALHKLIVANEQGKRNDAGYRDLKALFDHLKSLGLDGEYGMTNVSEFASEVMSNSEFQAALARIPYKAKTGWQWFTQAVRKLFGVSEKGNSALIEALTAIDNTLYEGRDYQVSGPALDETPNTIYTPETENLAKSLDMIGERKDRSLWEEIKNKPGEGWIQKARTAGTDSLAPMDAEFSRMYGNKIRDNEGNLNPMVLISRALDSQRVSRSVQETGGLYKDTDGLIKAGTLVVDGREISYQNVIKRIADDAKAMKMPYETVRNGIDNVLYGHREFELRKRINQMEATAKQFSAAGKHAEAAKLRASIPELGIKDVNGNVDHAKIDLAEQVFQNNPDIQAISKDLDTIRFNLIDTLVVANRLSPEMAQDYKDATGYIPFNRISDYETAYNNSDRGSNRGVAALKSIKAFKGDDRKSSSVIENFSGLVDWATREAMKNDAAHRGLNDMVQTNLAERVPSLDVIPKDARGAGVTIYDKGEKVHFYVKDPAHAVAFSLTDPQVSSVLKILQKGSQILRAGVTAMPPFAVKQIFDDIVRGYVYGGMKNPLPYVSRVLTNFPVMWWNEATGRKTGKTSARVKALEELGIVGTFDVTESGNLQSILQEAGAKKRGVWSTALHVMEAGAKASDLAVREAIFNQVLKETGDTAEAESRAREIINFSRRGSSKIISNIIRTVPFFNAYARGMDKLAVAAAGNLTGFSVGQARGMFYSRMGVLMAMGFTYAIMMQDDEEYNKLPDHVRDTNWVLPFSKELGFTPVIPIPADLAFVFKAIPERVVQYYKLQGTDEERAGIDLIGNLMKRGLDVISSPNMTPQLIRPVLENMVNYSFFMGRSLESQSQLKLRPEERYGAGTSDTAKLAAKWLENLSNYTGTDAFAVSPIKIENLIRGMFGTAAGIGLSVADSMVNPTRTDRPLHQQLQSQLTGVSAFMKDGVGTRYIDELYNLEMSVEQVHNTYNRKLTNDPEDAVKFLESNIGLAAIRPQVSALMDQVRTFNKAAMAFDKMKDIPPDERRAFLVEMRQYQNELAKQVYELRKMARDIKAES